MSYEKFTELVKQNNQLKAIPTKTNIYAKGIVVDNDGYIHFKGEIYKTDTVKLVDLPYKIRELFIVPTSSTQVTVEDSNKQSLTNANDIQVQDKSNEHLNELNAMLFNQLKNIVEPKKDIDINQEMKKANAMCNIADKMIGIADLSLKAKALHYKKFGQII